MTTYYKFLTTAGRGPYSSYQWSLPDGDTPGEWHTAEGELVACENGIHACRGKDVLGWLDARMFAVEYDGVPQDVGAKVVGRRARLSREIAAWNPVSARLFAADCAERVAHLWVPVRELDWSPTQTIATARRYAAGVATDKEREAADAAAAAAAYAAARAAVGVAADAAARVAAEAAAMAAAGAAAEAVRTAGVAAWNAARAGWVAVSAREAARDAESEWQLERFWEYVNGEIDIDAALAAIRESAA